MFLNKKLPPNMRTPVWCDLMDAIEEEVDFAYSEKISNKKSIYNTELMDYNRLIEISSLLRYPFDVSINNNVEFLREEVKAIPFKIKNKGTVKLYKSLFPAIKCIGGIFLYYYNGENLVRHTESLLKNANTFIPYDPYFHYPIENYSGNKVENERLDNDLFLDSDPSWRLDSFSSKRITKHFALEIYLNQYFYSGTIGASPDSGLSPSAGLAPSPLLPPAVGLAPKPRIAYLITSEFFSYISLNVNQSKRVTDNVHVGCQLCSVADSTHIIDSLDAVFTTHSLLMNSLTTSFFDSISSVFEMEYVVFGTGYHDDLPKLAGGGVQPTELDNKIAKIKILNEEKYESEDWFGVCARYQGFLINDIEVGVGDGSTTNFSKVLAVTPIKKGHVEIQYTSGGVIKTTKDNMYGKFKGGDASGTIDYETGSLFFETNIVQTLNDLILEADGETAHFEYQTEDFTPIIESTIFITYIINGTNYVAVDDGLGGIAGTSCTGTVTYSTGFVKIYFSLNPIGDINISYNVQTFSTPDLDTPIICKYYTEKPDTYISEAGVLDTSGNLIAYSTFPRIGFKDFTNHLSMGFLIKRTAF